MHINQLDKTLLTFPSVKKNVRKGTLNFDRGYTIVKKIKQL